MILDFREGKKAAPDGRLMNWDVVSLPDGDLIDDVFFADDEAGIVRYYVRGEHGEFYVDRSKMAVASREEHRPIKVVPRAESPRETGRPWRPPVDESSDSWLGRPPLL